MADQTFLMSELQRQEVRNVWEEVHSYLAFCLTLHLTLKLVVTQDKSRKIMMPGRLALCSKLYSVTFEASTLFCIPWDCSAPLHFLWLYSFIYSYFFLVNWPYLLPSLPWHTYTFSFFLPYYSFSYFLSPKPTHTIFFFCFLIFIKIDILLQLERTRFIHYLI